LILLPLAAGLLTLLLVVGVAEFLRERGAIDEQRAIAVEGVKSALRNQRGQSRFNPPAGYRTSDAAGDIADRAGAFQDLVFMPIWIGYRLSVQIWSLIGL
jgi:hypothetical protein